MNIMELFDRAVIKIGRLDIEQNKSYVDARKAGDKDTGGPLYDMDKIDGKSSALLTHISIILAALSMLIGLAGDTKIYFIVEFVFYAVIATTLLRCVDVLGPPCRTHSIIDNKIGDYWHKEATIRRAIYQWALRAVICLSIILVITVLIMAFE